MDRKKIKQEYKRMIPPKGVFVLKNEVNGRVFLGSTLNLKGVEEKNRFLLTTGSHRNVRLQEDWDRYGGESFRFEILQELKINSDPGYDYEEDLKILELIWVEKFRPLNVKCYNESENIRTV